MCVRPSWTSGDGAASLLPSPCLWSDLTLALPQIEFKKHRGAFCRRETANIECQTPFLSRISGISQNMLDFVCLKNCHHFYVAQFTNCELTGSTICEHTNSYTVLRSGICKVHSFLIYQLAFVRFVSAKRLINTHRLVKLLALPTARFSQSAVLGLYERLSV